MNVAAIKGHECLVGNRKGSEINAFQWKVKHTIISNDWEMFTTLWDVHMLCCNYKRWTSVLLLHPDKLFQFIVFVIINREHYDAPWQITIIMVEDGKLLPNVLFFFSSISHHAMWQLHTVQMCHILMCKCFNTDAWWHVFPVQWT